MNDSAEYAPASTTMTERLAAYGATAALVSGVVAAVGTVFLFATFASQASTITQPTTEMSLIDRVANGLTGLAMLIAIPIAFRLDRSWRMRAPAASRAVLVVGLVSLLAYGLLMLVLVAQTFNSSDVGGLSVVPLGGIGLWMILVSVGAADAALGGVLRWLGLAIGVGLLLLPIGFFLGGGPAAASNPQLAFDSPLLLVSALVSLLVGQIGYPVWVIWLGRRWRAGIERL